MVLIMNNASMLAKRKPLESVHTMQLEKADQPLLQEPTKVKRRARGTCRPSADTGKSVRAIGRAKMEMAEAQLVLGNIQAAFQLWNEALQAQLKRLGPRHAVVASTLYRRGKARLAMNRYDDALADLDMALQIRRMNQKQMREDELETANILVVLSAAQQAIRNYVEAESSVDEALSIRKRVLGSVSKEVAEAHCLKGTHLHQRRRYDEARHAYSSALAIYRALGFSESSSSIAWIRRFTSQRNIQGHLFWERSQIPHAQHGAVVFAEV